VEAAADLNRFVVLRSSEARFFEGSEPDLLGVEREEIGAGVRGLRGDPDGLEKGALAGRVSTDDHSEGCKFDIGSLDGLEVPKVPTA
jgi:hypothetical protein